MQLKINEWNSSYKNKDNFIFYPQEDIIRFISQYIRKRIGLNEFVDRNMYKQNPKVLDFGCGIGRHVKLLNEFNLDGYGFDLSEEAIAIAKSNFNTTGLAQLVDRVVACDITNLPYKDKYFDFMLSHGVLDSMPFEIAKKGMIELHRCLNDKGKIYFDVISDKDSSFETNKYEKTIKDKHEEGTIQSYFNTKKIDELIDGLFEIKDITLTTKQNELSQIKNCRFHIVVEKI